MKKYLFIFKSELMTSLQYIFNIMSSFIGYFIHIFIFVNLWKYMYSDPNELINGYTMNQMIWYVIITEIIWSVVGGKKACNKVSEDVKGGNIAYNINKPYNYVGYVLSSNLGSSLIKAIILIIIGMIVGYVFMGAFPHLNVLSILVVLVTGVLAVIISLLLTIFIGLFSFIIEDSGPFYWVYSKIILVLGTIFPIEYFPSILQPILKYSPVYVVSYGPARLFVNFSWSEFVSIFIFQIIYIFVSWGLCTLIYRKGVKNLNVNGG